MAEEFYGVRHSAIFYEIAVDHPDMPGVGHVGGNLDYMLARVDGNKDLRVHRIPVAKQPFLLVIEAKRKSARQVFRSQQLRLSADMPGMIAERLPPPRRALPSLDVRRVRSAATRSDFCAIGSTCFNVPLPWFQEVFQGETVWEEFASWVGYCEGEPVSTASTVTSNGVVGLYNVATLPGHQRRGYGEVMVRHAVEDACRRHGISRTVLQSTSQGLALYESLGYRTVTRVAVYSS